MTIANKRVVEITGSVVVPIAVGKKALIRETDGYRRTSRVLRTSEVSGNEVRFETINTYYVLHMVPYQTSKQ